MLVIHLNNGDVLTTDESYESFRDGIEDCNYGFVTIHRHRTLKDTMRSDLYKGDTVLTVIDKDEIAYFDVLEN